MVLQRSCPVENVFDQRGGNSNGIAKPLRQVEDQLVRGVSSGRKCAFGALALLARYSLLLNGDAALPIGEARKSERDDEAGGKASGQDIAAAGCPAAALAYERLRFLRRRRCVARTRGDPAFGLFQSRRAQQQAARTTGRRPVVRAFAVLGVLSDPVDVGAQRFCEPFGALFEFGRIVKEDKIQPPQGLGRGAVIDVPTHDRCEPLVQGGCVLDFLERLAGCDGIRREYEHDRIGLRDKRLQPLPPILEGVDLGAVDQRLESARLERLVEIVHEGHVSARIRTERQNQIFIPQGFAHGYVALSDSVQFLYKCSDFYDPGSECGIIWNDPDLAISWGVANPLVSEKDAKHSTLAAMPRESLPHYPKK